MLLSESIESASAHSESSISVRSPEEEWSCNVIYLQASVNVCSKGSTKLREKLVTNGVSACLVPGLDDDVLIKATDENTCYVFRSQWLHLSRPLHSILVGKACKCYTKINTQLTGLLHFYYRSGRKVKYESLSRPV